MMKTSWVISTIVLSFLIHVSHQLSCQYEVQVPCTNLTVAPYYEAGSNSSEALTTTPDSALPPNINGEVEVCFCQESSDETCPRPAQVECHNAAVCGDQGCDCGQCFSGSHCDETVNPNPPLFTEKFYSFEFERGVQVSADSMIKVMDADSVNCSTVEYPDLCPCSEIRFKLTDDFEGLFSIDIMSGAIQYLGVKGQNAEKYELEVTVYNNIPGDEKFISTKATVQITAGAHIPTITPSPSSDQNEELAYKGVLDGGGDKDIVDRGRIVSTEEEEDIVSKGAGPGERGGDRPPPGDRVVDSITLKNGMNMEPQSKHNRVKRGAAGVGVPDEYEFTLTALNSDGTFKLGEKISYKLVIHASSVESDVLVEIFSELKGGAIFMISNVRFGTIGQNFDTFDSTRVEPRYYAIFNDGRWDYVNMDLGTVVNSVLENAQVASSQIEILFDIQSLKHDILTVDDSYLLSVGVTHMGGAYTTISQDSLTYVDYTPGVQVDTHCNVIGPAELAIGLTGVWTVNCSIFDLYSTLSLAALTSLYEPMTMMIDDISVVPDNVGEFWRYTAVSDDGTNFTRKSFEDYGEYGLLELGTIMNAGYLSNNPNDDVISNQIVFQVAMTMLNISDANLTHPYTIGFTLSRQDMNELSVTWSAHTEVQAVTLELPSLNTSPLFRMDLSSTEVVVGGAVGLLLNITTPAETSAQYTVSMNMPVIDGENALKLEEASVVKIGFNTPHVGSSISPDDLTITSSEGGTDNMVNWPLGMICNTGQRAGPDDNTLQLQFALSVADNTSLVGQSLNISIGVSHGGVFYWVGIIAIDVVDTIVYSSDKTPEITLRNAMGVNAKIYPNSAAVIDIDMHIPPGVDYTDVTVSFKTPLVMGSDGTNKTVFNVLQYSVAEVGNSIYLSANNSADNGLFLVDEDPVYPALGSLTFSHATNLQPLDLYRSPSMRPDQTDVRSGSTIRLRVVLVARSDIVEYFINGTVHYTEVTVKWSSSYLFAGRIGVVYEHEMPNMYTGSHRQPFMTVSMPQGFSPLLAPGTLVSYTVEVGIPYQTSTDLEVSIILPANNSVHICCIKRLYKGMSLVEYDTDSYVDEANYTINSEGNVIKISHYTPMVSSYGYPTFMGPHVEDTYVTYEVAVQLSETAVVNTTNSFGIKAVFQESTALGEIVHLYAQEVADEEIILPVVTLEHQGGTDEINLGGSAIYFLDVYVPPNTSYTMDLRIMAPYNSSFTDEFGLVEVEAMSNGQNLPCSNLDTMVFSLTRNGSTFASEAFVSIVTSNSARDGETQASENLIRTMIYVALAPDALVAIGDELETAVSIKIGDDVIWVGSQTLTVTETPANTTRKAEDGMPTVELKGYRDGVDTGLFEVGGIQNFLATVTIPSGVTLTQAKLVIDGIDETEAYMTISDAAIVDTGTNMRGVSLFYATEYTMNGVNQTHKVSLDFASLVNTGLTSLQSSHRRKDDQFQVKFQLRMMDHDHFNDHFRFNISCYLEWQEFGAEIRAEATEQTEMQLLTYANDDVGLDWDARLLTPTDETIMSYTQVTFGLHIGLDNTSRIFPTNVILNFRVPGYSSIEEITGFPWWAGEYLVESGVLRLIFYKLRFDERYEMNVTLTIDPHETITPAQYYQNITLPSDVTYDRRIRGTNPAEYVYWYTKMKIIHFEVYIPECMGELGMQSMEIQDCQISASSEFPGHEANNGRFNRSTGWRTLPLGPPFYQNDYIQVDFNHTVKFTGITVQPNNDVNVSRPVTLSIQYSYEGVKYHDLVDETNAVKVFTLVWADQVQTQDYLFVPFEGYLSFKAKHVRLIPLSNSMNSYSQSLRFELHGCPKSADPYVCPSEDPDLLPYVDRQWFVNTTSGAVFICALDKPGGRPYCSGSHDMGASWFKMDNNLLNIRGAVNSTGFIYGIASTRRSFLRSSDFGFTWTVSSVEDTKKAEMAEDFIPAKSMPLDAFIDNSIAQLYAQFGFTVSQSETWSVSDIGVHMYPTNGDTVAYNQTANTDVVAFWGLGQWDGP